MDFFSSCIKKYTIRRRKCPRFLKLFFSEITDFMIRDKGFVEDVTEKSFARIFSQSFDLGPDFLICDPTS